ncbi:MAG: hypothetical protein UY72_C0003G0004 [Candidatus Uhrbacteria bacterium GW2011_GWD2_52_7]|uniref:Uncharacterized protein n=1 Tax=Candidatus Uhrbacteria bacterium GW2011_GWD2_52_7 TaxID=1618989 RepID=A0A0G1XIP1_9BACT|nr:MAG: hypothetical protein UY72_C0003G0004 [Candidatus Uhrbacteria bacterium GW2011_GWD2_52_7]
MQKPISKQDVEIYFKRNEGDTFIIDGNDFSVAKREEVAQADGSVVVRFYNATGDKYIELYSDRKRDIYFIDVERRTILFKLWGFSFRWLTQVPFETVTVSS